MKSRRGRGALLGLAIGATVGFVAGISDGDDPEGMLSFSAEAKGGMVAVVFGGVGALIGMAVAGEGEHWQPVSPDRIQLGLHHDARRGTGFRVCVGF